MAKQWTMSREQAEEYLARIGCEWPNNPSRQGLDALIYAHQCSVPFETIDMYLCDAPPDLTPEIVFDKMVTRRRGGFCFELNFLFERLLAALGYKVRPCLCRAVCGQKEKDEINHRALLVEIDGEEVFADVGFGGPLPCAALGLHDGETQVIHGETFITRRFDECWWAVDRLTGAKKDLYGIEGPARVQTEVEICLASVHDKDFKALNLFCSQPGTEFHDNRIANLRTPDGYRAIWNETLTVRVNGEKTRIPLDDDAAFADACEEYFGFRPE